MTVEKEMQKRSLIINLENGVNSDGSVKIKARTYSGIREDASVEACHAVGTALGGLMPEPVQSIALDEKSELTEIA